MAYNIYIGFTNYDAMHFLKYQFVGFQNFVELLNPNNPLSTLFLPTLAWTVVFAFAVTAFNYVIGLFLAVLLNNKNMRESSVYRALLMISYAVPGVISILAWQGLLNNNYGQINMLLNSVGIASIPWLTSPVWARIAVIMVAVWSGFPYMMMVSLGGLQSISTDLYEAAAIDGASWRQQFTKITMPALWRISVPLLVPSFAFNFNNFNGVYLLTGGGPARSTNQFVGYTDTLASAAYKLTLQFNKYDLASAISIMLFIIVAVFSIVQMKYTGALKAFEEVD